LGREGTRGSKRSRPILLNLAIEAVKSLKATKKELKRLQQENTFLKESERFRASQNSNSIICGSSGAHQSSKMATDIQQGFKRPYLILMNFCALLEMVIECFLLALMEAVMSAVTMSVFMLMESKEENGSLLETNNVAKTLRFCNTVSRSVSVV